MLKRYSAHTKAAKELSRKYLDAVRANEWGEAAEYCRESLGEIDQTIADLKGAPAKMSTSAAGRIMCMCLGLIAQFGMMINSSGAYFNQSVRMGITKPLIYGDPPAKPALKADLDTFMALTLDGPSAMVSDTLTNAAVFAVVDSIFASYRIVSDTIKYIVKRRKGNVDDINVQEINPIFCSLIADLERAKASYLKLLAACEAERDAQVDEAIEAYIDQYMDNMERYGDAMEGATIDALQAFRYHCKEARGLRGQLNKLRKAGKTKEAADIAQKLSKIAGETIRDIDLIPDDATVPWLMDIAVMFLGCYLTSAIMNATVGKFFNWRLAKKASKIEAASGKGTEMSINSINQAAEKSMKTRGGVQLAAQMIMGNPLGALLAKINQKASGDKEQWGDNDRNLIINALRIQAKHVRDKYAKLASQLRAGKNPSDDEAKEKKAVESFNIFGLDVTVDEGLESEVLSEALYEALGNENYAVFESYLESITDEEYLEAAEEGFCMALDAYEESVLESDIFLAEAFEGQSAKKDVKLIFKRFKKEIRAARSEMKKCDRKKDWAGASAAAQKAADIARSMLQECDAVPPDTKGTVMAWLGFIVVEILLAAVVMTIAGAVTGVVKDLPGEVDKAWHRTVAETTTGSAKDGIKASLAKKLNITPEKLKKMKEAKTAASVAANPGTGSIKAIKNNKQAIADRFINGDPKKMQGPVRPGESKIYRGGVVGKLVDTSKGQTVGENAAKMFVDANFQNIKNPTAKKAAELITKNGAPSAAKNLSKAVSNSLNGPGAKQGKAVGGAVVGGLAGFKGAQKISKTASLLFKKKAMNDKGDIDGTNVSINDFHPLIAAMKNDIAKAVKQYEAYAKMYKERGKSSASSSSSATESWLFSEKAERQDWLFG